MHVYIRNQKETTGLIQDGSTDRIIVGQQRGLWCYSLFFNVLLDLTSFLSHLSTSTFRAAVDTEWHNMAASLQKYNAYYSQKKKQKLNQLSP